MQGKCWWAALALGGEREKRKEGSMGVIEHTKVFVSGAAMEVQCCPVSRASSTPYKFH